MNTLRKPSSSQGILQKLDQIDDELSHHLSYSGSGRWMIPYADLLTLLLGFFLVLYLISQFEHQKMSIALKQANQTIQAQQAEITKLKEKLSHFIALPVSETPQPDTKILSASLASQPGIQVKQEERGIVISLLDNVLFSPGNAALSSQAQKTLDKLGHLLQPMHRLIRVEGYTDNTPIKTDIYPSNWELSTARATNIVRYFVEKHEFSPEQLSAAGYGEFKPIANNSTIEGKQKNRRVDIVILNNQAAQQEPRR